MKFIHQQGYTVRAGQDEAHQRWIVENDDALRAASPPGLRYIGTFGVIFSSEKTGGGYIRLVELESYAAMDTWAEAMKDPTSEWARLNIEREQFLDPDVGSPWSNGLWKNLVGAAVWDMPDS